MKIYMPSIFITLFSFVTTFSFSQNEIEEAPFAYVEKMPSFPGGTAEMYKYIYGNLKYPAEAFKNKISGQVIVQYVVAKDGTITDAKVIRGIGYGCDEEAVRVVESMNEGYKWEPGQHNGRAVPATLTLPIKFHIQ